MDTSDQTLPLRIAFWCACASVVTDIVSIAACQILLGAAILALLVSRTRLRIPPVAWPACTFFLLTVVSWAASGEWHAGLPQIRKFYVWLLLFVLYQVLRKADQARWLMWACAVAGTINAAWALRQYLLKHQQAARLGRDFYDMYIGDRIKGYQSHWMTFSGVEMVVMLMLAALLLYVPLKRWAPAYWAFGGIMMTAVILSGTRGVWVATAVAGMYLVWTWRPKLVLLVPVALVGIYFAAPANIQRRVESIYKPDKRVDSNEFRIITRRTGLEMMKAHPLLGVGPELVGRNFSRYLPADITDPLPPGYYQHLHNIYIHYGAERGIPAMLALLWFFARALFDFLRTLRKPQLPLVSRAILCGAVAVVIAIMVEGLVEVNLGDSEVLALFMGVVACGYAAVEEHAVSTA